MLSDGDTGPSPFSFGDAEKIEGEAWVAYKCPVCDGDLIRVRRRPIDRLLCLFIPLRRFRCVNIGCIWEGNLRKPKPRHHRATATI